MKRLWDSVQNLFKFYGLTIYFVEGNDIKNETHSV